MVITSPNNTKILEVCKLTDKKYRKLYNKYIIEGARLVNDAIKFGADVLSVFVKESVADSFCFENKIVVSDKVFAKMSDTVNSQGVLAIIQKHVSTFVGPLGNSLVLDNLQDPGNVGTLIRTAVACGFTDIYAVNCVDLYSPKVLRSAMSAHFCINLYECDSVNRVFEQLKGVELVACDLNGDNVFKTNFCDKVALILGNEGNGLSEYSKLNATRIVSLPMANEFESLNVSVAGSVIMYQIYSKNFQ